MRKGTLNIAWKEPEMKTRTPSKCIIIVPVYKDVATLSKFEKKSIERTIEVLGKEYEILLLCGFGFDVDSYINFFKYDFSYMKCTDEFFVSQKSYSDLCEKYEFYEALSDYEYMLICQPDAWVFEDKLDYFISLGYDYIGAVHMLKANGTGGRVGNGGFSLRKIAKFAEVCKKTNFEEFRFTLLEDCAFTITLKREFNIAPVEVGFEFGWQEHPRAAYAKMKKLPFGCHNPAKNDWNFWREYIKMSEEGFDSVKAAAIVGENVVRMRPRYTNSVMKRKRYVDFRF